MSMILVKDVMHIMEGFEKIRLLKDKEKELYGDYPSMFLKTRKMMNDFIATCESNKENFASELTIFENTMDVLESRFNDFSKKSIKQDELTQDFINNFNKNYKDEEFISPEDSVIIGEKAEEMLRNNKVLESELKEITALNDTLPSKIMDIFKKAKGV